MRRYPPPLLGWLRFFSITLFVSWFFGFRGAFLSLGSGCYCIDTCLDGVRDVISGWQKRFVSRFY